jgi:chaperone LolA
MSALRVTRLFLYATAFGALLSACASDTSKDASTTTETTVTTTTETTAATPAAAPDSAAMNGPAVTPTSHTPDSVTQSAAAPARTAAPALGAKGANSADGAKILTRTAAKYKNISTMRADFTMRVENTLLRSSATTRGRLYSKRPDRIALRFTEPKGDVILSDGTYFWVYTPSSMPNQVIRTDAAAGANAVDLQAQFVGDPVKRFHYTMSGAETVDGHVADIIDLVPTGAAPYQSMRVWIDRDDSLVRRFDVVETSGVKRHLDLVNLSVNAAIDPSVFRFSVPAGVRVVGQ